jgi:hypothetical protein
MQHIAPLIQTILWVALIGGIVWRFNKPIHGLLSALQKRVEGGSNVKAGPFELIDQLRPQEPEKQKQKVEAELLEATPTESIPQAESLPSLPAGFKTSQQAIYFQAEDLALRAIQAEYGQPISRQLTAGSDIGFDGVFTVNGRLNIVEVKYVRDAKTISRLRISLERLVNVIAKYNWKNVQLILVVVFERTEDVPNADISLLHTVKGLEVPVSIRPFALKDLQRRFGVPGADGA